MNKPFFSIIFLSLITHLAFAQNTVRHNIYCTDTDISGAFTVAKIALQNATIPKLQIAEQHFTKSAKSIADSALQAATQIHYRLGIERKKPYLIVSVPAFQKNGDGKLEELKHYSIDITEETKTETKTETRTMRTTTTSSVLANGSWQKISVAQRGVFKIDYDFVKNTLQQSAAIQSSSIRLFGNGGTMLYESNAIPRPDDLIENAIEMHDGGDGQFDAGDYFLFYANGPTEWVKDSANQLFRHRTNLYSDKSFYYITFNNGNGLRMGNAPNASSANRFVNSYNEYALHEKELINLGLFGKTWWGETFNFTDGSNIQSFDFPLTETIDSLNFTYQFASAAVGRDNSASLNVSLNGISIGNHSSIYGVPGTDGDDPATNIINSARAVIPASGNLRFTFDYNKYVSNAKGYLDFIEVNVRRNLSFTPGTQLSFRDWRSVGTGAIAQFSISNANANLNVWDVSNPLNPIKISGNLSGTNYSFTQDASSLHEYIATDNNFLKPEFVAAVANQNLHGLSQTDYIIVSHPDMIEAANKLADFHRSYSKLNVTVVPVDLIYNEFGSGSPDISAIRDFVKMFYNRAENDENQMPKYLLLLGQGSYDYKNISKSTAKLVPTYETAESLSATSGYCSDDFFAILDSNESISAGGLALLDLGVGRIPATSKEEAMAIVEKIIRYKDNKSLGAWRLNNIYVGDNADGAGDHLVDADDMSKTVEGTTDIYTSQKVYLDNLNFISSPGGARCPDANKAINDNMFKGAFLLNYSGHGNIYSLAHERVITQDDYNAWNNQYKLPIMITATCDFSRFDNPALQSAGEKILLKKDGGAIALITTTQVVYAGPNKELNSQYLLTQFTKQSNGWFAFGDAFAKGKNKVLVLGGTFLTDNSRKFALLGDPALVPNFPRYDVITDSMLEYNGNATSPTDSVKSLGRYRVYASVRDDAGNVITNFNGKATIAFYDKAQKIIAQKTRREYALQNNIIYRGTATVKNGVFIYEFITPKDINYELGKGKIQYYAENGETDAAGADTTVTVGSFANNPTVDNDAPIVRPFMNDSLFQEGGLTGNNSVLFAIITDNSGINVSGNFVGHDLTAVLDDAVEVPYILNDYYETAPNTYKRGYVSFPMKDIADGLHTLRVKAWDVFNNSGEGQIAFEVLNGDVVKIRNIKTYPNPFSDITHFIFEHNHPNEALTATINIYNTSGSLVRTLSQSFTPMGSNSAEIIWDGKGNGGEKLMSGVYACRIKIATEKNNEDLGYQKVVIIR